MKNLSTSNILILISVIISFLAFNYDNLYIFGLNSYFLDMDNYLMFIFQIFLSSFLHCDLMHLLSNIIVLFLFGNIVEFMLGKNKYIIFFIFISLLNASLIIGLSDANTIGISGFGMAILAYYMLELKYQNNPDYKGGILFLLINIGIGFIPGISLLGHLFGAIGGIIFFVINHKFFREKFVGV